MKQKVKLITFRVWSLETWGNSKDGYEVNDRREVASIQVPEGAGETAFLRALKAADLLNKKCRYTSFSIDESGVVYALRTDEPLYQIEDWIL